MSIFTNTERKAIARDLGTDCWLTLEDVTKMLAAHEVLLLEKLRGMDVKATGFMWQHDETGRIGFAEESQKDKWAAVNPRLHIIGDIFTATDLAAAVLQAVEAEREECAQACQRGEYAIDGAGNAYYRPADARWCVAAIRARKEKAE